MMCRTECESALSGRASKLPSASRTLRAGARGRRGTSFIAYAAYAARQASSMSLCFNSESMFPAVSLFTGPVTPKDAGCHDSACSSWSKDSPSAAGVFIILDNARTSMTLLQRTPSNPCPLAHKGFLLRSVFPNLSAFLGAIGECHGHLVRPTGFRPLALRVPHTQGVCGIPHTHENFCVWYT